MEQIGGSSWYFGNVAMANQIFNAVLELENSGKVVIEVVPIYCTGGELEAVLIRALGG